VLDYSLQHIFEVEFLHHEAISVHQKWVSYKSDQSCDVEQRHHCKDAVSISRRPDLELAQLMALGDDIVVAAAN
jgi:hypothetical protein